MQNNYKYSREIPNYETIFWEGKKNKYCLIIPVINEGIRIKKLIEKINKFKIFTIIDIIIVDGLSIDNSIEKNFLIANNISGLLIKKDIGALSSQLRIGYGFAMRKRYKGVVTIDGNNKDCPSSIGDFIAKLEIGYDLVQGSRFIKGGIHKNTPLFRYIAIRLIHAPMLSFFSGFKWTDTTQGYRAYSSELLLSKKLSIFRKVFQNYELLPYLNYSAPKFNFRCIEIPTTRIYPPSSVPTKIKGFGGIFRVFLTLIKTCLGLYSVRLSN